MPRREFSRKIRAQIIHRAMNENGQIICEGCGLVLGQKPYQVDHILEEGLRVDKTQPLTAEDGQLLGQDCCHAPKTKERVRMIRKSDRQRDKHTGAAKKKSQFACSRDGKFKQKLDGTIVRRDR